MTRMAREGLICSVIPASAALLASTARWLLHTLNHANGYPTGGGKWHPEAPAVNALRTAIDRNPRGLKDALADPAIRKEFLNNAGKTDAAVVKEFVRSNADSALKTRPKVRQFPYSVSPESWP